MATDVFGDSSLFDEFEKDRLPEGSYIKKDLKETNDDDGKHIVFKLSDEECSSNESDEENVQQQQQNSSFSQNDGTGMAENNSMISDGKSAEESSVEATTEVTIEETPRPSGSKLCDTESKSVLELARELEKSKRFTNLLNSTRHVGNEEGPAVQIIFQNNVVARKYRNQIEEYVSGLIQQEKQMKQDIPSLRLKASTLSATELNPRFSKDDSYSFKTWSSHSIIGCSQMYSDFIVDTLGWPLVEYTPALTDGWEIPTFDQLFPQAFPYVEEEESAGPAKRPPRPKATCFNCGESHMLSECTEPKDQARIRQNRRQFLEQNNSQGSLSKGLSQSRYHIEEDPRFSGFKPGQVSEELRQALGLKPFQIPSYIYKMRLLGYPPGWLQDVEEQTSGISLFDKHGNEVDLNGESLEDGEMGPDEQAPAIDPSKIIEYEGFTMPLLGDKVDECNYLGMPPIQPHQLKKYIEAEITNQKNLKRKLKEAASRESKRRKLECTDDDMDLDSDFAVTPSKAISMTPQPPLPLDTPPCNPPLPEGTPPPTPPVSQGQGRALSFSSSVKQSQSRSERKSVDRSEDGGTHPGTPDTLEDLESQYKVLMQQLAKEEGEESDLVVMDSYDANGNDAEEGEVSQDDSQISDGTQELTDNPDESSSIDMSNAGEEFSTPKQVTKPSVSISKDYGTPVSKASSFSCLPNPENFGKDTVDLIPFENLPGATGRFGSLKGILGRIREMTSTKKIKTTSS